MYTFTQACENLRMYQSLKEYIRLKTGLQQTSQEVKEMELRLSAKLDYMASFINLCWPDKLELDSSVLEEAKRRFASEFGALDFNTSIHKNDLMFAFHLNRFTNDPAEALKSYYGVGFSTAKSLKSIADKYGISPNSLLDFGSGYGRVSRFLSSQFPDANCVISEVKRQAVEFQEEELGIGGLFHDYKPEEFPHERFDLILALSVFTHLPEALFRSWMKCLAHRLQVSGAMVISFLDQDREASREILKNFTTSPSGIEYIQRSEDSYFTFVSDRLKDEKKYGSTFISRTWLSQLADSLGLTIEYLNYDLVKSQDAAILMPK